MIVILPETKGISLERMDKLFGEIDTVEAGEQETSANKIEANAYAEAPRSRDGNSDLEKSRHLDEVEISERKDR